jgi:hypothetical protein
MSRNSWNMLTWVLPSEHPGGLLGQPCPVCGYAYGSEWLHEAVPASVLAAIAQFPALTKGLPGRWAKSDK